MSVQNSGTYQLGLALVPLMLSSTRLEFSFWRCIMRRICGVSWDSSTVESSTLWILSSGISSFST